MNTFTFTVTIPNLPDTHHYTPDMVGEWLRMVISHPHDAAFEADVEVKYVKDCSPQLANPERENNGCMAHKRDVPPS